MDNRIYSNNLTGGGGKSALLRLFAGILLAAAVFFGAALSAAGAGDLTCRIRGSLPVNTWKVLEKPGMSGRRLNLYRIRVPKRSVVFFDMRRTTSNDRYAALMLWKDREEPLFVPVDGAETNCLEMCSTRGVPSATVVNVTHCALMDEGTYYVAAMPGALRVRMRIRSVKNRENRTMETAWVLKKNVEVTAVSTAGMRYTKWFRLKLSSPRKLRFKTNMRDIIRICDAAGHEQEIVGSTKYNGNACMTTRVLGKGVWYVKILRTPKDSAAFFRWT